MAIFGRTDNLTQNGLGNLYYVNGEMYGRTMPRP
jgi:hypothetical protein